MISFKIPTNSLRLFLIALNMNFNAKPPDYIFQVPDGFEIVYTTTYLSPEVRARIDLWVIKLCEANAGKHDPKCDIDPDCLKWRFNFKKSETAYICGECYQKILARRVR